MEIVRILRIFLLIGLTPGFQYFKVQQDYQVSSVHWDNSFRADPDRNVIKEALSELFFDRLNIFFIEVRSEKPDTAVDVETNATCK